ncbi:MAG: Gfo/Idh/MocA family oxidoreductase [Planctomycetales bacterium]|nr:Gfo/Idh/MocA family oxidoreductase [Planctomycetales bacterium]
MKAKLILCGIAFLMVANACRADDVFKLGIIGLDTSHATAFTKLFNTSEGKPEALQGFQVVAAYPQGSPDIESSTSRVPKYTEEVQKMGVQIVDSIPALLELVDGVLLETNDGRPHLTQVRPVLAAKKPVFIDKPLAGSLADVIAIQQAAAEAGVPIFSSSSLRYMPSAQEVRSGSIGDVVGCDAYSPCHLEKTHPDFYWYGIHGVEILFTVMGRGCETVTRSTSPGTDVAVGVWQGGRIGTFRGIRDGKGGYGGTAFGRNGSQTLGPYGGYQPLLEEIADFFRTGKSPVSDDETLEIYAFMEAADESKRQGGVPVRIADVIQKAKSELANVKDQP